MLQLSFIAALDQWDWLVFQWVNQGMSNAFFDVIMPWMRNRMVWLPLYVLIISFLVINWKRKGVLLVLFLFFTVSMCDFGSSGILKPLVERIRPCNDIERYALVNARVECGVGYSFPSSHATNHIGIAVFLFLLLKNVYKRGRYLLLAWALLISFAQIYVGVHYPIDILAGLLLGSLIALASFELFKFVHGLFGP